MIGYLFNPAKRSITEITLRDAGHVRSILEKIECSYPLPGWICAVEIEGENEITHTIDGHMCCGRTILYTSDEIEHTVYALHEIKEMTQWLN